MTNTTKLLLIATLLITACSKDPILLPDEGPTSSAIWSGSYSATYNVSNQKGTKGASSVHGYPISMTAQNSTISSSHLAELNQDFQEVPNPKIIGYVYPHFNEANMPIPGFFTAFRLYKQNHYALMDEGVAEGIYQ